MMKTSAVCGVWVGAAVFAVALGAHADSYSWQGSSGRFAVSVDLLGFNEGAGEGGWDEASARDFAAWARRFNMVTPSGASVTMRREAFDDDTTLTIRAAGHTDTLAMAGGPDLAAALRLVAARFHAAVPPAPLAPPTLYTVQLLAVRSEALATAFVAHLEASSIAVSGSFYDEACHPCSIPAARVLPPQSAGFYRVISGVFDQRDDAARALARLRHDHPPVAGWVRPL